jgi:hypothetical protein
MTDVSEFIGLTSRECCDDCTPERCVISGSLVFRNDDGTTTRSATCGHPAKGSLQPIQQMNPEIVSRHGRAKKFLALAAVELKDFTR